VTDAKSRPSSKLDEAAAALAQAAGTKSRSALPALPAVPDVPPDLRGSDAKTLVQHALRLLKGGMTGEQVHQRLVQCGAGSDAAVRAIQRAHQIRNASSHAEQESRDRVSDQSASWGMVVVAFGVLAVVLGIVYICLNYSAAPDGGNYTTYGGVGIGLGIFMIWMGARRMGR